MPARSATTKMAADGGHACRNAETPETVSQNRVGRISVSLHRLGAAASATTVLKALRKDAHAAATARWLKTPEAHAAAGAARRAARRNTTAYRGAAKFLHSAYKLAVARAAPWTVAVGGQHPVELARGGAPFRGRAPPGPHVLFDVHDSVKMPGSTCCARPSPKRAPKTTYAWRPIRAVILRSNSSRPKATARSRPWRATWLAPILGKPLDAIASHRKRWPSRNWRAIPPIAMAPANRRKSDEGLGLLLAFQLLGMPALPGSHEAAASPLR